MVRNLKTRFSRPVNPASGILLGGYTFLWGLFVCLPFWDAFTREYPIYHGLNSIAGEYVWGAVAIVCGIGMIWGILTDRYKAAASGCFLGFMHWLLIGIAFIMADIQNVDWVTAFAMAILCGFMYLNLRINRKILLYND